MKPDAGSQGAAVRFRDLSSEPGLGKPAGQDQGRRHLLLRDWQYCDLDGCHPGRERPCMNLGEVSDQPFHAAEDAAMDHDRALKALVWGDVAQGELPGLMEVELNSRQG